MNVCRRRQCSEIAGECPEVTVLINDVEVHCLLDSGSQVSTITESFLSHMQQPLEDVGRWLKIFAANRTVIPCLRLIAADVTVLGTSHLNICFLVVEDPQDKDCLARKTRVPRALGANFLQQFVNHQNDGHIGKFPNSEEG